MGYRDQAKFATTIVLHALQQMFVGEQKKDGLAFEDLACIMHEGVRSSRVAMKTGW